MRDKGKRFPLPLASVVEKVPGLTASAPLSYSSNKKEIATPQTATKNAAQKDLTNASSSTRHNRITPNSTALVSPQMTPLISDAVRTAMVVRLSKQGIKDIKVLNAMQAIPRHMFVEPGFASQAYIDASLPIGHHQTISQPYIVARMIEIMRDNTRGGALGRVLEIGTGCGYQVAVLSQVVDEVYSIERIKALHELAKLNLRPLRIANIRLHYGDGMLGLPQASPFDGIILAAAGMEVPQALLEQLSIGGRLIAPVGMHQQALHLIERVSKFEWTNVMMEGCHFVPLRPGVM